MNTSSRFVVAVHIMTALAGKKEVCTFFERDPKVTSDELADSVNTNPVVIRRILSELQDAGLVVSKTGRAGGTTLAKPAAQITLRDIHQAVEDGDLFHLHYNTPNPTCPIGGNIQDAVSDIFAEARESMLEVLAGQTVADVAADVMERSGINTFLQAGMSYEEIRKRLEENASSLFAS